MTACWGWPVVSPAKVPAVKPPTKLVALSSSFVSMCGGVVVTMSRASEAIGSQLSRPVPVAPPDGLLGRAGGAAVEPQEARQQKGVPARARCMLIDWVRVRVGQTQSRVVALNRHQGVAEDSPARILKVCASMRAREASSGRGFTS